MEPFSEIEVSTPELQVIARGLYAVASVDGLHEREVTFISQLLGERSASRTDEIEGASARMAATLEQLAPLGPPTLAALLPAPAHRHAFLKAAYMLAWADGKVSFAERASIDAFASALGVGPESLARLESAVKDHLAATNAGIERQ